MNAERAAPRPMTPAGVADGRAVPQTAELQAAPKARHEGGAPGNRPVARRWIAAACAVAILAAGSAIWVWRFDREMSFYGDDDASYLILGEAISLGRGYRMITDPLEPVNSLYPPGYPLLIAGVALLLGNPDLGALVVPVKVLGLALYLAAVTLFLCLERRREGWLIALAATAIFALHPEVLRMAGEVMSEVPFLCFSLLGLLAFDRLMPPRLHARRKGSSLRWVAAAAALTFPVYLRTIGMALPLAAGLLLLWRRRIREALLLALASALFLVPLGLHTLLGGASGLRGTYLRDLVAPDRSLAASSSADLAAHGPAVIPAQKGTGPAGLLGRARVGFWFYRRAVPAAVLDTSRSDMVALPPSVSLLGLVLILSGYVARLRAGPALPEVYLPVYMGVLLLWPYHFTRFLIPIIPWLALHALKGVELWSGWVARPVMPGVRRALVVSAVVAATAFNLGGSLQRHATDAAVASLPSEARNWGSWMGGYIRAAHWLARVAPPDAVIYGIRPRYMSVLTGRRAGTYLVWPTDELVRRIRAQGSAYIVEDVSSFAKQYLRPALDALESAGQAELVHREGASAETRVWLVRVERPGRGAAIAVEARDPSEL